MMSTGPLSGAVTLGFYLLSQPTAEEATMLWLSCTLSSPGKKENAPLQSPDTLIYVYCLVLRKRVKYDKAHTCRRRGQCRLKTEVKGGIVGKQIKDAQHLTWCCIEYSTVKLSSTKIGTS